MSLNIYRLQTTGSVAISQMAPPVAPRLNTHWFLTLAIFLGVGRLLKAEVDAHQ